MAHYRFLAFAIAGASVSMFSMYTVVSHLFAGQAAFAIALALFLQVGQYTNTFPSHRAPIWATALVSSLYVVSVAAVVGAVMIFVVEQRDTAAQNAERFNVEVELRRVEVDAAKQRLDDARSRLEDLDASARTQTAAQYASRAQNFYSTPTYENAIAERDTARDAYLDARSTLASTTSTRSLDMLAPLARLSLDAIAIAALALALMLEGLTARAIQQYRRALRLKGLREHPQFTRLLPQHFERSANDERASVVEATREANAKASSEHRAKKRANVEASNRDTSSEASSEEASAQARSAILASEFGRTPRQGDIAKQFNLTKKAVQTLFADMGERGELTKENNKWRLAKP